MEKKRLDFGTQAELQLALAKAHSKNQGDFDELILLIRKREHDLVMSDSRDDSRDDQRIVKELENYKRLSLCFGYMDRGEIDILPKVFGVDLSS